MTSESMNTNVIYITLFTKRVLANILAMTPKEQAAVIWQGKRMKRRNLSCTEQKVGVQAVTSCKFRQQRIAAYM
jgi:hypothetical protein